MISQIFIIIVCLVQAYEGDGKYQCEKGIEIYPPFFNKNSF